MQKDDIASFKDKLDKEYEWPSLYMFKFIVPSDKKGDVLNLFSNHEVAEKASSKGNYVSLTAEIMVQSSDKVIEFYIQANKIEGVIAL